MSEAFEPVFSAETVKQRESYFNGMEVNRRIAMMLLTRTQAELAESAKNSPDVMLETIEALSGYLTHLEEMRQCADAARARVFTVMIDVHGLGEDEAGEVAV